MNTNFENPNGLDTENHYSTAKDLAILAAYAMKNPVFQKIVSTKTVRAAQVKIMAAFIADLSRKVSTVLFFIDSITWLSEAITSLLVESSATLSMLLAPPINAQTITGKNTKIV